MVEFKRYRKFQVTLIGDSESNDSNLLLAMEFGREIAKRGWILITGGRTGIMEAASKSAIEAGGITVGITPHDKLDTGNKYLAIEIPTGMGYTRNSLNVLAGDVVVGIGGKSGTLSEFAFAWMHDKPIIAFSSSGGWSAKLAGKKIDDRRDDFIIPVETVPEAIIQLEKIHEQWRMQEH